MIALALPAAAGVISEAKSAIAGVENFLNPGASRDAQRKGRVAWLEQAALSGSVLAARILLAGPDNVSGNESGYFVDAQNAIRANAPGTWAQAANLGGYWPNGAPFDMPDQRAQIAAELSQRGASAPSTAIPSGTTQTNPIQQTIGDAIQQIGSQIANNGANAVNPSGNYQTIPTNTNTLLLVGAGIVALIFFMRK